MKAKIKSLLIEINCYDIAVFILKRCYYWQGMLKQLPYSLRCYLYNYICSYVPCHIFRLFMLEHLVGVKLGRGVFIHLGAFFAGAIAIGDDTVIGRDVHILGNVTIGAHSSISAETYMVASGHDKNDANFKGVNSHIIIDDYVWTGTRAMILMGTHIYTGGVLGAASVLTKDIPPFEVYAGVPAKKIGERTHNLNYELKYFPWFN